MQLKPCPFCGSNNLARMPGYVQCNDCRAEGPFSEVDADCDECGQFTVALWNNRHAKAMPEITEKEWERLMEKRDIPPELLEQEEYPFVHRVQTPSPIGKTAPFGVPNYHQ